MRRFEKISFNTFKKEVCDDNALYDSITLPKRCTKYSAAYDIKCIEDITIKPGKSAVFNTGLKVCMNSDEVLYIFSRSSFGYKYDVCLTNCVGVIDSDYYNNSSNEGHFKVKLTNNGDNDFIVNKGDRIAQGVFMKYLVVDEEEEIKAVRLGGVGSTGKGNNL